MRVEVAVPACVALAWALPCIALAQAAPAPPSDLCRQGYVWREAFPGDRVCVVPSVRAQAAEDNSLANVRRSPADRSSGPDTCQPGYVWREARPDDHVCVPSETRAQAAADNEAASGRAGFIRTASRVRADRLRDLPIRVPTPRQPMPVPPPSAAGAAQRRGFDEGGAPYVEETTADGARRRTERTGVRVIHPDGTEQFYPHQYVRMNVPPAAPPELPGDSEGFRWVQQHNDALFALIEALVNRDPVEMEKFTRGEQAAVGADPYAQIVYRTKIAGFLAVGQ